MNNNHIRYKIMNKLTKLFLLLAAGIIMISCGDGARKDNVINLTYVNWAEGIAMTNVAKVVLEENGYQVKMQNADSAPVFASLSRGTADVFLDVWMPVTHEDYMNQYGDKLEILGENYDEARIGLVVPAYVDINSIEELNEHKDKFKGEIVGIDAGAGIMKATEKAIPEYDLDFRLLTASGAAMTATLKKSIDKGDWVVVTGWTPHWKFSRFELKMLEDPKGIYGDSEKILTVARKGFSEEQPFVAAFLSNMKYSNNQISELMAAIEDSNEQQGAKEWIEANRELVNSWVPQTETVE